MQFDKIRKNLEALGYTVSTFQTAQMASDYLDDAIDKKSVGFGGSMTLLEMGLYEKLKKHNHVFWHWKAEDPAGMEKAKKEAQTADIYLSSVNGISENGEIINIDGQCNRVAGMLYGHEKVYFVIGSNKIASDYERALFRARNTAAPLNARRLKLGTPCATKESRCYDCKSPDRICRALSVLWEKPMGMDCEIILIEEELGY